MRCARGRSLVELVVIFGVIVVVVTMAVSLLRPAWSWWSVEQTMQRWVADMHAARYHALVKGVLVTICPSADGVRCTPFEGWGAGWLVFEDIDGDGRRDGLTEAVLRSRTSPVPWRQARLRATTTVAQYVMYTPQGRPRLSTGAFQAGRLEVCDGPSRMGVRVVMNAAGRWRWEKMGEGECE